MLACKVSDYFIDMYVHNQSAVLEDGRYIQNHLANRVMSLYGANLVWYLYIVLNAKFLYYEIPSFPR